MNTLSNEEKARLILSLKRGRVKRFLSPMQVAEYIERCINAGSSVQSLAEQLDIGREMLGRFLSLLKLSTSVQSIVEFSASPTTLSFSVAHQISRLDDPVAQEELAKAAIACGFSKQDVSQVIQRHARSGDSIEKSVEAILALRPTVERRHVVIGSVTSESLKQRLVEVKSQDRRDSWGRGALSDVFRDVPEYAVRITPDRFTLSGDDRFFAALMKLKPDFETAVNTRLLENSNDI